MNKKAFWKVLALMLVVVLAFALLTACGNKKPADSHDDETPSVTPKEPSDKNTGSSRADRQNAFLDTLFNGANEIVPTDASGNKIKIDTGEGKDIGFNIGLTLTLDIDGEKLPVGISAKAFLDRVTKKHEQKIDKTFASILAEEVKLPDAEAKVDYDKDEEYPSGTEYWCRWYETDENNKTVIDISVSVAGAESLGIYYEVKTPDIIYLTVGGNKYAANLARVFKLDKDEPPWMPGLVYNLCERLITSDLVVKLADAFNAGDGFDLNKLFSDLLNKLLGGVLKDGETLYSMLEGVELMSINVGDMVFELFGEGEEGKKKAKDILGENIDVLGLLKAVKGMILSEPEWTWFDESGNPKKVKFDKKNSGKGSSPEYDSHIAKNLAQHLKAYADIVINVGGMDLNASTILKDGHIRLGYEKAAGENGKNGKLDNFWLELMLDQIPASDGSSKSFGLKVQIDDLSFFVEKDASIGRDVSEYGPLAFDAEIKAELGKDAFDIFFENDKAGYRVSFGNDKLVMGDHDIMIPETVTIGVKGALDLVASEGTKIVLSLTCAGSSTPLATAQIYGIDGKDSEQYRLQGDVKVDKNLLDYVTGILKEMSDGRPIGKDGFAWNKTKGKWGFWGEDGNYKEECLEGVSEALDGFLNSGEMHIEPIDPFELIEKAKRGTLLINYEGTAEAAATMPEKTLDWILNALFDKNGVITLFADLFAYAGHTLTIGGKGVLGTVFNNTLYYVDPASDPLPDIFSSIYSMLGYFTSDPKLTDIREAYEFLEKKVYDFNTGYKHVRPAAAGKNSADKLIEEWNAADNDKKGGITAELESKGYAVIPTNIDGTAVVHYPMNLFKLVLNDARSKVGQLKADEDIPELGDGFKLVEVSKNFENVTAQDGLSNEKTNTKYQIISKSIDELKAAYKADSSVENAVLLMRRGVVYEKAGEKYNKYDVLVDEQMLSAADLTIEISSENKDGKVSNGSLDVNAAYDGSEAHIGISVKMVDPEEVVIDHGLVSDDCVKVKIGIYKI